MFLKKFQPFRNHILTKYRLFGQKSSLCAYSPTMGGNSNLKPPDRVAGLKILDKQLFEKTINVSCLVVPKDVKISSIMPIVRKYLLKLENFKPVQTSPEDETRVYLNPDEVTTWDDLSDEAKSQLKTLNLSENLVLQSQILRYENYSLESILRAVLPPEAEGMSSFTKVGHIVHVNLREHLLPYKEIIGQVLFDKVANCRSVVNKVANIDNTYRNFQMEVLRGEDDMLTTVKENKCLFKFDFSKVYWNSRLCTEHERIVNMIEGGSAVFDVFAGVGPFSVPLAKKKCKVFANDLNPESYKWLVYNSKANNVDLQCFNKDGRDFILGELKTHLIDFLNVGSVYIIMNLPALAVEFLNSFVGLYDDIQIEKPAIVIVYCFAKGEDYENIAKNLLFEKIGRDISDKIIDIFRVRTVSSMKEMMRIRFKLDRDILVGGAPQKRKISGCDEQLNKKCCHGEEQAQENQ